MPVNKIIKLECMASLDTQIETIAIHLVTIELDDLPAFATYEAAEKYSKAHNGKRIMNLNDISDALIRLINGRI